jgi:hypothetical protein
MDQDTNFSQAGLKATWQLQRKAPTRASRALKKLIDESLPSNGLMAR